VEQNADWTFDQRYPTLRNAGKCIRLARLVNPHDHRSVIATVAHGLLRGPMSGEGVPSELGGVVKKLGQAGIDGIVVSPGFLQANATYLAGRNAPGIVLCLEWNNVFRDRELALGYREGRSTMMGGVEDALRLGADAVMTYIFLGYDDPELEANLVRENAILSRECERLGMVRIIETMARGARLSEDQVYRKEYVALHSRIAYEVGCDFIKTEWTGDVDSFREAVRACPIPIFLAGGPHTARPLDALKLAEQAIQAGAMGLVFGRNIIQAANREGMAAALKKVVHDGWPAEQAAVELELASQS
jgi:DhnA family fructose-bisphosphate aldolase class Ia